MSEPDPPPLDEDVRALLKRTAGVDPAPAGARMRVLARLESALAPVGADGGAGPGGGETASVPATVAAPVGLARRLLPFAFTFALGAGVGGLVVSRAMRAPTPVALPAPPPRVVYVDRPVTIAAPDRAPDDPSAPHPPPGRKAGGPNRFVAERRLLDVARGALERAEPGVALDATTKHERAYPDGVLVQEREAMAIRALAMLGRLGEARQRAGRFRTHFPDSALWPAIEATVGAAAPSR